MPWRLCFITIFYGIIPCVGWCRWRADPLRVLSRSKLALPLIELPTKWFEGRESGSKNFVNQQLRWAPVTPESPVMPNEVQLIPTKLPAAAWVCRASNLQLNYCFADKVTILPKATGLVAGFPLPKTVKSAGLNETTSTGIVHG